MQSGLNICVYI